MSSLKAALEIKAPRILTLDIETSPNLVETWGLFNQNVSITQIREPGRVLCFGAKWYDSSKVDLYAEWEIGHDEMVQAAWDLLDQADIVVTYNGPNFDIKHLQREFILAGMPPPLAWKDVDLLKVVRREFKFTSNKLDFVAQALGVGRKAKHEGHSLWTAVLSGDEKACRTMGKYCKQDVKLTEKLYDELGGRGWIKNHPHFGLYTGDDRSCPACGGADLTHVGWARTAVSTYALMRCDNCMTQTRMNHVKSRTITRPVR